MLATNTEMAEDYFKQLGWEKQEDRLAYWKTGNDGKRYCIAFLELVGKIHLYCVDDEKEIGTSMDHIVPIGPGETFAMCMQCIELRWLRFTKEGEK